MGDPDAVHLAVTPLGHEIVTRDKANLDITWLRAESLEVLDNLPAPDVIAGEIVEVSPPRSPSSRPSPQRSRHRTASQRPGDWAAAA